MKLLNKNYLSMSNTELLKLAESKGLELSSDIRNGLNLVGNDFKTEKYRQIVIAELEKRDTKNTVFLSIVISFVSLVVALISLILSFKTII